MRTLFSKIWAEIWAAGVHSVTGHCGMPGTAASETCQGWLLLIYMKGIGKCITRTLNRNMLAPAERDENNARIV